jgi:hypothetical protein
MSSEAKRIEAVIEHRRNSRLKMRSAEYRGIIAHCRRMDMKHSLS